MGEIDKDIPKPIIKDTQLYIKVICQEIQDLLLEKNRCYGDSAANPVRIFSQVDPIEQINVRIDDKLSRLKTWYSFSRRRYRVRFNWLFNS